MGDGAFIFVAQGRHGSIATVTHERGRIMEWSCALPNSGDWMRDDCYAGDVALYRPGRSPLFVSTPTDIRDFVITGDFYGVVYDAGGYQARQSLAVDEALHRIYITQRQSGTVLVVDLIDGVIVDEWRWFDRPSGITVDDHSNVYVTEFRLNQVIMLSPTGEFITSWGTEGTGDGQFDRPFDVAVGSTGNVYVTDLGNQRVQVVAPAQLPKRSRIPAADCFTA